MELIQRRIPAARYRYAKALENAAAVSWRRRAARPMLRCICLRSRTSAASSSICSNVAEVFKKDTIYRRFETGRPLCCQRLIRSWWRPAVDEDAARPRFLHGDCVTVTGRTVAENMKRVTWRRRPRTWSRPADNPLSATGGVVGLKGNLAPAGAIVKVAGMANLKFTGPARCFDGEEACFEAVKNKTYS